MDKAGQPLADPDSRVQQGGIMGLCQRVGEFFIRHMGQDEVDVYAPLCRELESRFQLAVEDEIGRHDMDVALARLSRSM